MVLSSSLTHMEHHARGGCSSSDRKGAQFSLRSDIESAIHSRQPCLCLAQEMFLEKLEYYPEERLMFQELALRYEYGDAIKLQQATLLLSL